MEADAVKVICAGPYRVAHMAMTTTLCFDDKRGGNTRHRRDPRAESCNPRAERFSQHAMLHPDVFIPLPLNSTRLHFTLHLAACISKLSIVPLSSLRFVPTNPPWLQLSVEPDAELYPLLKKEEWKAASALWNQSPMKQSPCNLYPSWFVFL